MAKKLQKLPLFPALMEVLALVHCALLSAAFCAAVFAFLGMDAIVQPIAQTFPGFAPMDVSEACLRGLLFFVPVLLSRAAVKKLPAMWQYLLASFLIAGLSWLLMGHALGAVMAALCCLLRGRARMAEETERSLMDEPHISCLFLFLVLFLLSAVAGLAQLQRLSVLLAGIYFLVYLAYDGLGRIQRYLALNRGMAGLPARRIRRTAGAAVLAAVALSAALLLPAASGVSGNFRIDPYRKPSAPAAPQPETFSPAAAPSMSFLEELAKEDDGPGFQIPPFVGYLFYALGVGGAAVFLLYAAYQLVKNFRASYTDSRDEVRFLSAEDRQEEPSGKRRINWKSLLDRSPNARIRRHYRKTVLRAAGKPPEKWQSPAEIESAAGISDDALHQMYEKARYGRTS